MKWKIIIWQMLMVELNKATFLQTEQQRLNKKVDINIKIQSLINNFDYNALMVKAVGSSCKFQEISTSF